MAAKSESTSSLKNMEHPPIPKRVATPLKNTVGDLIQKNVYNEKFCDFVIGTIKDNEAQGNSTPKSEQDDTIPLIINTPNNGADAPSPSPSATHPGSAKRKRENTNTAKKQSTANKKQKKGESSEKSMNDNIFTIGINNIPETIRDSRHLEEIIKGQIKDIQINEILFNRKGTLIKVNGTKSFNSIRKLDWSRTELKEAKTSIDRDTRPWLCVNRMPVDVETSVITTALTVSGYECDSIQRAKKRDETPITLIKFRINTEKNYYKILRDGFKLGEKKVIPVEYIDRDKMLIRCYNCNKIGHYQSSCKSKKTCPRCSREKCNGDCVREEWQCINCGGPHSAAYNGCPKIQERINTATTNAKIKTYANVVTARLADSKQSLEKEINTVASRTDKYEKTLSDFTMRMTEQLNKIDKTLEKINEKLNVLDKEIDHINEKFLTPAGMENHLQRFYISTKQMKSLIHLLFQGLFSPRGLVPQKGNYSRLLDKIISDSFRQTFPSTTPTNTAFEQEKCL